MLEERETLQTFKIFKQNSTQKYSMCVYHKLYNKVLPDFREKEDWGE